MNIKQEIVKHGGKLTRFFGKTGLKVRKYSPEILVVTGTVSVIAGVVLACKATLKAEEVLDKHQEEMDVVREATTRVTENGTQEYTDKDRKRDTAVVYAHTVGRFIKLYAPGAGFTLLGIGCYLGAYGILKKRNVALMAAYKALESAFADYRKRVIEDIGEEKDREYRYGVKPAELTDTISMDGSEKTEYTGYIFDDGRPASMYARLFSPKTSTQWNPSNSVNLMNLNLWQNWSNDLFTAKGWVDLNTVYEMLGFEPTKAGQIVGWVKNNPNGGDNYINFRIQQVYISEYGHIGYLIDPNVDGIILDLI